MRAATICTTSRSASVRLDLALSADNVRYASSAAGAWAKVASRFDRYPELFTAAVSCGRVDSGAVSMVCKGNLDMAGSLLAPRTLFQGGAAGEARPSLKTAR